MATHYRGKKAAVRALDSYLKLMRAADTLGMKTLRYLKDHGLTESQFGVLESLHHLGPMQQNVISEKLLKSGGNITMVINNLEKQNLIRREVNPSDRRCVQVHLTDKGRALITGIFPAHVEFITAIMKTLSADEQEHLGRLCRKLGTGVATQTS
jgi:MarR family 2-MHQ and catechol resistance regulon transcriptional repressor